MNTELKEKMPSWCQDVDTNFQLMMSDDIDSLMCYILQKEKFGREVEYFYNANLPNWQQGVYSTKDAHAKKDNMLALDIALEGDFKAWDNHVTRISESDTVNINSANLNTINNIHKENYTKKYCVSSFLTMMSYYDIDISKWEKEQIAFVCCIDGVYYPFTQSYKYSNINYTAKQHLKSMGYEFLIKFIEDNMNLILRIERECNLKKGKIWINDDGYMETNIYLNNVEKYFGDGVELPKKQFKLVKTFKKQFYKTENLKSKSDFKHKLFNFVLACNKNGALSY